MYELEHVAGFNLTIRNRCSSIDIMKHFYSQVLYEKSRHRVQYHDLFFFVFGSDKSEHCSLRFVVHIIFQMTAIDMRIKQELPNTSLYLLRRIAEAQGFLKTYDFC